MSSWFNHEALALQPVHHIIVRSAREVSIVNRRDADTRAERLTDRFHDHVLRAADVQ
jgi:hypothetical protein